MRLQALLLLLLLILFSSCGSSRSNKIITKKSNTEKISVAENSAKIEDNKKEEFENTVALSVIDNAMEYMGVKYKYGGTSKKGMDCSGLIYTAFLEEDIELPRVSRYMAMEGEELDLREVVPGDLLFFQTNKNKKVINHVGLVVRTEDDDIKFIHSSTSRGVITSSINERYWKGVYVAARRVL